MVRVARGPGKTTCKHCSRSVGPKALKIVTSYGSYHVGCWKPPRPFQLNEFEGFGKLDNAGKESFQKTVEKWLEPFNKEEAKIEAHNEVAAALHRQVDMGDHKALKIVEGFDAFSTVPTLVLSHIAGFLDGKDLIEIPSTSKHWNEACKDDLVWKGACRLYPAGTVVHDKLNKPWKHIYNVLTNLKARQGYCVECGMPTSYSSMFQCFLCPNEAGKTRIKYKTVSNLRNCGLTASDVDKYGIRAEMGEVEVESWKYYEVTFPKRVVLYSLADVIQAQKQKAAEKASSQKRKHEEEEEEEEEEEKEADEEVEEDVAKGKKRKVDKK
eukprot:Phypoly_transcript_12560.p1 GENE.Phypoly_transcript_12560~~Phypoly_transcript_12560.p1  ORF type:complete len:325 (+),score=54.74 Phypoly_transcript_12560:151-1125(+)